jgi:cytoskeletal protein CcmA (bactofilin family)
MDKDTDQKPKDNPNEPPALEVLQAQFDEPTDASLTDSSAVPTPDAKMKLRHYRYRPSHKATFIGLAVVAVILLINAGIIIVLMNIQSKNNSEVTIGGVKISPAVLETLGVSRNTVGKTGSELVVNPDAKFTGNITVGGNISIAGKLQMNSGIIANDATFTKLTAGDTSLSKLNVNGDATISSLALRNNLSVAGSTTLQGPVVVSSLMTVSNSMNVAGNLAVGGVLSVRSFEASSLTSDTTLTIGGHIITRGNSPSVSKGSGLNVVDTVSISGSDSAGTVGVNIGAGGRSGIVANISFVQQYGNTPHVVIAAVGGGVTDAYVNRTSTGFSIGVGSIAVGGHSFDYIVMQ